MNYLVFGMGGVGASIFERLSRAGLHATGIARGASLTALHLNGLAVTRAGIDSFNIADANVASSDDYTGTTDVVFVCVKGYSLESVYPFLQRVCTRETVVIPLLNLYGTGERMAEQLNALMGADAPLCTCGCIYVSAELSGPGVLLEHGQICRIFFGMPDGDNPEHLQRIAAECTAGGCECLLSDDIRRDTLGKFTYVSPMGATAIIHASNAGDAQVEGRVRNTFANAIREVASIGETMGIRLQQDMVKRNLAILDTLDPIATTSMQRDLEAGRPSEYDGLIEEVIRMGLEYGVPTPTYLQARQAARERFGIVDSI